MSGHISDRDLAIELRTRLAVARFVEHYWPCAITRKWRTVGYCPGEYGPTEETTEAKTVTTPP